MRIAIDHTLKLTLLPGTSQAVFHLLLTPSSGPSQTVASWTVDMPGIERAGRFVDGFGNLAHLVNQTKPEGEIVVRVKGVVTTQDTHGVLGRPVGEPVPALFRRLTALTKVPPDLVEKYRTVETSRLDLLHALMADVSAQPEAAEVQAQVAGAQSQRMETVANAKPSPTDLAHGFIAAARALDIPARLVIGYRLAADEAESGLHAWAEAFDEGLGWIGFDPSQQICPTDAYVRLATGLDADTAVALRAVPTTEITRSARVVAG